jgi:hypothetical protein
VTEPITISLRDVRSGGGVLSVAIGQQRADCDIADISGIPSDLTWSALTALHHRYPWRIAADDEPGYWLVDFKPVFLSGLDLRISHADDDGEAADVILTDIVDQEAFARAVLAEMTDWRDVVGAQQFESQFFAPFPNRMLAALESALALRPREWKS